MTLIELQEKLPNNETIIAHFRTNGIESFWATLKRAIIGSYHHVSTKYLQTYVNECCFRQNNRGAAAFDKLLMQSVLVA